MFRKTKGGGQRDSTNSINTKTVKSIGGVAAALLHNLFAENREQGGVIPS